MSAARDRIAVWLDDDRELRIPDTPWGRALYADLREVLAAGSHDEWACKGNQRLYQEATAERDRLAETLRLRSAALDRVVAERAAEVARAEVRGKVAALREAADDLSESSLDRPVGTWLHACADRIERGESS